MGSRSYRNRVETFLTANGLRFEEVDSYYALLDGEGRIVAGAGLRGDVVKCVAVDPSERSGGLLAPLVSHIISQASRRGVSNLKVFTKPQNEGIFGSLGFHPVASAPKAILMENGCGLEEYLSYLRSLRQPGRCGAVVMNANPFTLGHRYLVEKALERVDHLFIIPVRDENFFPYRERLEMIRAGVACLSDRVTVADGSAYCISAATFPTYFLKELSDASETQMRLDINLFRNHIAPALEASVRFVGSEPFDPLTARYNVLLQELMPGQVVEVPRLEGISASAVRRFLDQGECRKASSLTPETTHPYLLASLAARALRLELDTPLKPGLVCPDSRGAHKDMDHSLMLKGIAAIRPFFPRMVSAGSPGVLRQAGIDAENAMLAATGGVNTHRGAIFALGLALAAAGSVPERDLEVIEYERFMQKRMVEIAGAIFDNVLVDSELQITHGREAAERFGVKGARDMAADGYKVLFGDWLPYYRSLRQAQGPEKTLLRIMATLDDTCVIHRVGLDRAREVKDEAKALLESFSEEGLKEMKARYDAQGISPGGAADMLALTIFMDSLIN